MRLRPDYNLKSLFEIDETQLKADGIEILLFDLDSTIMASKAGVFKKEVLDWLSMLQKNFRIAVLSNNTAKAYIEKVSSQVDFDVIGHAKKPSTRVAKNYLDKLQISPAKAVVIGDRPLTDILVGKLLGAKTILVDSITCETEPKLTRAVRWLERLSIAD